MTKKNIQIAPSLLSANFSHLGDDVQDIVNCGADLLHLDIMDGHFVPNLTFGPDVVKSIRTRTSKPFDTHLMVTNPEMWLEPFAKAGSQFITFHIEVTNKPLELIKKIKALGCGVGVSLNPATKVSALKEVSGFVDLILVMSVNPGFGGQGFVAGSIEKVKELEGLRLKNNYKYLISVDGGVTTKVSADLIRAGVDILVSGSFIFKAKDKAEVIKNLRKI